MEEQKEQIMQEADKLKEKYEVWGGGRCRLADSPRLESTTRFLSKFDCEKDVTVLFTT